MVSGMSLSKNTPSESGEGGGMECTIEKFFPTMQAWLEAQSREYYRVPIEPPLLFMCTVRGCDVANTLERMRLPA
jgi:hypothetical protein